MRSSRKPASARRKSKARPRSRKPPKHKSAPSATAGFWESVDDILFSLSPRGEVLSLSPSFTRLTGWRTKRWIGKSLVGLFAPGDLRYLLRHYRGHLAHHSPSLLSVRLRSRARKWIRVEARLAKLPGGRGFVGTARPLRSQTHARSLLGIPGSQPTIDAFLSADASGKIVAWSAEAEGLFGWSEAEALGASIENLLVPPRAKGAHRVRLSRALSSPSFQALRREGAGLHRDGREVPIEITAWKTSNKDQILLNAYVRDISGRKALEARLTRLNFLLEERASENEALADLRGNQLALTEAELKARQSALENALEGIAQLDASRRLIEVNATLASLLGFRKDLLLGKTWDELVLPEDRLAVSQAFQIMLVSGKSTFESRAMRADGAIADIEIMLIRSDSTIEGRASHHCFVRDISPRKEVERRLRDSEKQYRLLFEHNPAPMFVYAPDTFAFLAVNRAAIQRYGYTREQFLQMTLTELRPREEVPNFLETFRRSTRALIEGQLVRPGVLKHRTKRGEIFEVEITFSLIRFRNRVAHLSMAIDVSERLKAESLVEQQRSKMIASSRMSALGEMAGGIAHEINTPLTVLYGRTTQLKSLCECGKWDQAIYLRNLTLIESTALKISGIVRGLRAFARDGAQDPLFETPVKSLIDDTLAFCQEKLKYSGITLHVDPIPESLTLSCRPPQISQVLLNLLNNACDAVDPMPEKWIRIGAREIDDSIEFSVTDSGNGIPVEHHHKLFQPFFTTKEVGRGTGLGLSISEGIVKAHRGTLTLDVTCPHTRFLVVIPKNLAKPKNQAA